MRRTSQFAIARRVTAIAVAVGCVASNAWGSRVIEKDGVAVRWPAGSAIAFELQEYYPDSLSAEAVRAAVSQAMQIWNAQTACSPPNLSLAGPAAKSAASGDGKNTIAWIDSDWVGITKALAESPSVADVRISQGSDGVFKIVEADIYLNAEGFLWITDIAPTGTNASQLVQSVKEDVAHELGHALGLDHPCEYEPPQGIPDCSSGTYSTTLMFPNPRYVEPALGADDVNGLCSLYRAATPSTSEVPERGFGSVEEGGKCTEHKQCWAGLACINGKCAFGVGAIGDACEVHGECRSRACINGACRVNCTEQDPCDYENQVCDEATSSCGVTLKAFGKKCDEAEDCVSAQCVVESAKSYCTKECLSDDQCPSGWQCAPMNDLQVCRQTPPATDGCSITSTSSGRERSTMIALLLGIGILGLRIRRQLRMGEN